MNLGSVAHLLAASALALVAHGAAPVRSTFACDRGADFNPVAASDVIVSGLVLGWAEADLLPDIPEGVFVEPVLIDFQVEDVLKGEAPERIRFLDTGSLASDTSLSDRWVGTAGACGAFEADPTGQYAFLGLTRDADGNLRSSGPLVFYIGERSQFAGFRYERTAEILGAFGLKRLPAAGYGTMARASAPDYELLAFATLLIAFGLGGLVQLRRTA